MRALDSLLRKKTASLVLLYGRRAGRWPWRRSGVGSTIATRRDCSRISPERLRIPGAGEQILGIMAKKVEDKEKIRGEGFLAIDLQDLKRGENSDEARFEE